MKNDHKEDRSFVPKKSGLLRRTCERVTDFFTGIPGVDALLRFWRRRPRSVRILVGSGTLLLVVVGVGSLLYTKPWRLTRQQVIEGHRQRFFLCESQGTYAAALNELNAIEELGALTPADRWQRYRLLKSVGNAAKAKAELVALAPDHEPGFAKAHAERAMLLYREHPIYHSQISIPPELLKLIAFHLEHAAEIEDRSLLEVRSVVAFLKGNFQEAANGLDRLIDDRPELTLMAAEAHRLSGNHDSAVRRHRKNVDLTTNLLKDSPDDLPLLRSVANSQLFLREYRALYELLEARFNASTSPELRQLFLEYVVTSLKLWSELRDAKAEERFPLLRRLLEESQHDMQSISCALEFAFESPENRREFFDYLSSLSPNASPATIPYAQAMLAWQEEDWGRALKQIEAAYQSDSDSPMIANNFAYFLVTAAPERIEEASAAISQALAKAPNSNPLLDTQALVLARNGNDTEAITIWEKLLKNGYQPKDIYKNLSVSYRNLGSEEVADRYAALAPQN